jgi:hypothetical protein
MVLFLTLISQIAEASEKDRMFNENKHVKAKTANLEFLKAYNGKYVFKVKLFSNFAFTNRLKNLVGSRINLIVDTCTVASPILVNNNQFVMEGCQPHNCPGTNFIIVYDFTSNVMCAGVKKEYVIRTFSENGGKCKRLTDWTRGNN